MAGDVFVWIYPSSDEDANWAYDRYRSREAFDNDEEAIDGGLCTGDLSDAIEMALS